MNELLKTSQSINSDAPPVSPFVSNTKPPKPPVPPKQTTVKTQSTKDPMVELEKIKKEQYRLQINEYIESKVFRDRLADSGFETIDIRKAEKLSCGQMKEILEGIQAYVARDEKKKFVETIFYNGVSMVSAVAAKMTMCPEYLMIPNNIKAADEMRKEKGEPGMFTEELEELSILMDSKWVPGPEKRIAIKLAQIILYTYQQIEERKMSNNNTEKNKS